MARAKKLQEAEKIEESENNNISNIYMAVNLKNSENYFLNNSRYFIISYLNVPDADARHTRIHIYSGRPNLDFEKSYKPKVHTNVEVSIVNLHLHNINFPVPETGVYKLLEFRVKKENDMTNIGFELQEGSNGPKVNYYIPYPYPQNFTIEITNIKKNHWGRLRDITKTITKRLAPSIKDLQISTAERIYMPGNKNKGYRQTKRSFKKSIHKSERQHIAYDEEKIKRAIAKARAIIQLTPNLIEKKTGKGKRTIRQRNKHKHKSKRDR